MSIVQPSLFKLDEEITIQIIQLKEDLWQANIADGWWTAIRRTKKDAVKTVLKRYEDEVRLILR